jgi:hypothetical protein
MVMRCDATRMRRDPKQSEAIRNNRITGLNWKGVGLFSTQRESYLTVFELNVYLVGVRTVVPSSASYGLADLSPCQVHNGLPAQEDYETTLRRLQRRWNTKRYVHQMKEDNAERVQDGRSRFGMEGVCAQGRNEASIGGIDVRKQEGTGKSFGGCSLSLSLPFRPL